MTATQASQKTAMPRNALLHFASSVALEVGTGSARLSFLSSISKAATRQAYAP